MNGCFDEFSFYHPPVWLISLSPETLVSVQKYLIPFSISFLITRSFQLVSQARTILKYPF